MTASDESAHFIRGITFDTVARHFPAEHGAEAYTTLIAELDPEIRAVFGNPELNHWYPERFMGDFFHVVYDQLARRDDERFLDITRRNMASGVSRFMKAILSLASGRFVLKNLPVAFRRGRKSPAVITPRLEDDVVQIDYHNFPFASDPVYRLLSLGNCQGLVLVATKKVPPGRVIAWGDDSMTLEFDLPRKPGREPEVVPVLPEDSDELPTA